MTESEWEYAARGGSTTKYFWGNGFDSSRANNIGPTPVPVGLYDANGFGLHDMHGNVSELVEDCWHGSYQVATDYEALAQKIESGETLTEADLGAPGPPGDGGAWTGGGYCKRRVLRGGSWFSDPRYLRSAHRSWSTMDARGPVFHYGFRVARTL